MKIEHIKMNSIIRKLNFLYYIYVVIVKLIYAYFIGMMIQNQQVAQTQEVNPVH
jgi:hypothetical protein